MKTLQSLSLVVAALLAQGCAHSATEKKLDEKIAQEPASIQRSDVDSEATRLIQSSTTLSDLQKAQLMELRDSARNQSESLNNQSLKLRSVLVKNLIVSYDKNEINLIKKKIKALENKRVSVLFDTIDRAKKILGHQASANPKLMSDLLEFHGNRGN